MKQLIQVLRLQKAFINSRENTTVSCKNTTLFSSKNLPLNILTLYINKLST
jgi:hypothetical protein